MLSILDPKHECTHNRAGEFRAKSTQTLEYIGITEDLIKNPDLCNHPQRFWFSEYGAETRDLHF